MRLLNNKTYINHKAQAVMELAIFGAILLFVIGLIIRQALSFNYQQNNSLKAMRQAMSLSFRYSHGSMGLLFSPEDPVPDSTSHNRASVLWVEDRLVAGSGKYAEVKRVPFILTGAGTHSNQLFQPIVAGSDWNLPIYDIYVNGKYFPFLVANFKRICLAQNPAECTPGYDLHLPGENPAFWQDQCAFTCPAGCRVNEIGSSCVPEQSTCGPTENCDKVDIGCALLKTKVFNIAGNPRWCDGEGSGACPADNFTLAERFDLDQNGTDDVAGSGVAYRQFSWQWFQIRAFNEAHALKREKGQGVTKTYLNKTSHDSAAEGIAWTHPREEPIIPNKNISVDVDGDLKLEQIVDVRVNRSTGVILEITVIDSQDGDMDFTYNTADYLKNYECVDGVCQPDCAAGTPLPMGETRKCRPGFTRDVSMITKTKEGNYLLNEEGRLFTFEPNRQFVRNVQRADQVNIVERVIQLSNDTDRFCDARGNVVPLGTIRSGRWNNRILWTTEIPNPVEACNNCYSPENAAKTCMDEDNLLIYVRTQIQDQRARKWVTDVHDDAYIEFDR